MSNLSISDAYSNLFTAPLKAVIDAERDYLELWLQRLKMIKEIHTDGASAFMNDVNLSDLIDLYVPTVRLEGNISTSLTMRIAGVKESSGGLSAGLTLGPIHASGAFGFTSRKSEESVFQASTEFVLSNKAFSLTDYLKASKQSAVSVADLDAAVTLLGKDLATRPSLPAA